MGSFWDFLRPLDQLAVSLSAPIQVIVLIVSIVIFGIALLAYLRKRSQKLLFVTAAFFLFMVKWIVQVIDLFISPGLFFSVPSQGIVELATMILLLLALFKK